jgi:hypothetical protein
VALITFREKKQDANERSEQNVKSLFCGFEDFDWKPVIKSPEIDVGRNSAHLHLKVRMHGFTKLGAKSGIPTTKPNGWAIVQLTFFESAHLLKA